MNGPALGTLFVANTGSTTVTGYGPGASGNATPAETVGGSRSSLAFPTAQAFDAHGDLWVGNEAANDVGTISELTPSDLASSGAPSPHVQLVSTTLGSISLPAGLAFDSAGNLWVANEDGNTVVEFSAAQLATSGAPTPAVTLSSSQFSDPTALAFDGSGNLWVDQLGNSTITEFTPAQLAATGAPTPNVILSNNGGSISAPDGIAFDGSGNLWSANDGSHTLVQFTSAQLASSGNPVPPIVITSSGLQSPSGITFDKAGDLWVGNTGAATAVEFSPSQLAATGSPAPNVTLSSTGFTGSAVRSPLFDSSGMLWVLDEGSNTVLGFDKKLLTTSSSAAPTVTISNSQGLEDPQYPTFDSAGNMWVTDYDNETINAFTPAQIAANATQPAISITVVNPNGPAGLEGLAFDAHGNLWVTDFSNNSLYEYTPGQLATSGRPTPTVTLHSGGLNEPTDVTFDSSGNLWALNFGGNTATEYPPAQLAASGTPTPSVVLTSTGTGASASLNGPDGFAFDAAGDLWITNGNEPTNDAVVKFTPSQLASSGNPTPSVILSKTGSGASASLNEAWGMAFDGSGNLWVANFGNHSVVEFASSLLTTSGSPTPTTTIAGAATGLSSPGGIAFPPATQRSSLSGYWLVASDGGIFSFGNHPFYGSTGNIVLNKPIVGMAATPTFGQFGGKGYWLVATDGGIFSFGDAQFWGSTGSIHLNQPVVGMAPTPDGKGYWLVASDGGIFSFGDAQFFGSTGSLKLNKPIVGMSATPDGKGYWLDASDGGIFSFGDAKFFGSTGAITLNKPMVGMATTPSGKGYWLVASDGGIFSFGDAQFFGSTGALVLNKPVVGMATTPDGKGYWLDASDGGIFSFGDAQFFGSTGNIVLNKPMVGMAT